MNYLDLTYLKEISGNDQDFIRQMLMMFLDSASDDLMKLQHLVSDEAWGEVKSLAHKIKGPVQMINERGAALLSQIETEAANQNKTGLLHTSLNELVDLISKGLKPEVEAFLRG